MRFTRWRWRLCLEIGKLYGVAARPTCQLALSGGFAAIESVSVVGRVQNSPPSDSHAHLLHSHTPFMARISPYKTSYTTVQQSEAPTQSGLKQSGANATLLRTKYAPCSVPRLATSGRLLASCYLQLTLRNLSRVYIHLVGSLAMRHHRLVGGITWQGRGCYASGQRSGDPAAFAFPRNHAISWLHSRLASSLFENNGDERSLQMQVPLDDLPCLAWSMGV